jgi:hypothetical protein
MESVKMSFDTITNRAEMASDICLLGSLGLEDIRRAAALSTQEW